MTSPIRVIRFVPRPYKGHSSRAWTLHCCKVPSRAQTIKYVLVSWSDPSRRHAGKTKGGGGGGGGGGGAV